MCLIIHQPRGVTLARAILHSAADRNPDGFGMMYAERGRLHVLRTLDPSEALAMYKTHGAGRECVLHWRQATHGRVDIDNAHPFQLSPDVAVVHNGMLSGATPTPGYSDTWHWARHILAPMTRDNPGALFDASTVEVLAGVIGSGNKLAAMNSAGRVSIIGRSRGVEHLGCWFSNVYAWAAPAHLTTAAHRGRSWGWWEDYETAGNPTGHAEASAAALLAPPDGIEGAPVDMVATWRSGGELALLAWIADNPTRAADVLADWYQVTDAEATELVDCHPESVAEWLAEIAEGAETATA